MSLRLRFLLSLLAVLVLMAGPALYAVTRVAALRDMVLEVRGQAAQSALAVGRLEAALVKVDRSQRVFVATAEPEMAARMHEGIADVAAALGTLHAAGHGDLLEAAGIGVDRLRASAAHLERLVEQRLLEEATSYLTADAAPLVEQARSAVPAMASAIDLRTSARVPVARRTAVAAGTATTAAVLVGVALAIALALASAGVLTGPLDGLRRAMARVAEGNFEAHYDLPYDRADEVGDLSRSFRTMTRRLAELDRLKAEFVGAVSHDLKTPVSVIAGYSELVQEELRGTLSSRQRELLRCLSDQTRTLQRRIDQLSEISRLESGRLRLGLEEIEVRHFLAEICREYEPAARMRDVDLALNVHDATPAFLIADPDVLRTDVIGNLLNHALSATPPGGSITLAVRPDGQRVTLEVADTGPGIPAAQLERIFDRYYQARGTATGPGLALAIARAGVENHGGRIDVHSRVGRGTRFRVTLPIRSVSGALAGRERADAGQMTSTAS